MMTSFEFLSAWVRTKARTERGASLVEYALLIALIAVVAVIAVTTLGDKIKGSFNSTAGKL